jgi:hypothetical protein
MIAPGTAAIPVSISAPIIGTAMAMMMAVMAVVAMMAMVVASMMAMVVASMMASMMSAFRYEPAFFYSA